MSARPKLAVWKFASCDGCQLALLDAEDELLAIAAAVEIAYFPEATRSVVAGPYDISLVEGSVTTEEDASRILEIREATGTLIAIGACAAAGGIQALRNGRSVEEICAIVYPQPEQVAALATSTPISSHVTVDFTLWGCPIDTGQLLEVLSASLVGRRPDVPGHSVCVECKAQGITCVMVAEGTPCLGPVTRAGCGALCPAYRRGCYGCFGPAETANVASLASWWRQLGVTADDVTRALRSFNAAAPEFQEVEQLDAAATP